MLNNIDGWEENDNGTFHKFYSPHIKGLVKENCMIRSVPVESALKWEGWLVIGDNPFNVKKDTGPYNSTVTREDVFYVNVSKASSRKLTQAVEEVEKAFFEISYVFYESWKVSKEKSSLSNSPAAAPKNNA